MISPACIEELRRAGNRGRRSGEGAIVVVFVRGVIVWTRRHGEDVRGVQQGTLDLLPTMPWVQSGDRGERTAGAQLGWCK